MDLLCHPQIPAHRERGYSFCQIVCRCNSECQESSASSSHPKYFPVFSSFFYLVAILFIPLCPWEMQEMLEWWILSACSACLSQILAEKQLKPKVMSTKNLFPSTNCTNLEVNYKFCASIISPVEFE